MSQIVVDTIREARQMLAHDFNFNLPRCEVHTPNAYTTIVVITSPISSAAFGFLQGFLHSRGIFAKLRMKYGRPVRR